MFGQLFKSSEFYLKVITKKQWSYRIGLSIYCHYANSCQNACIVSCYAPSETGDFSS